MFKQTDEEFLQEFDEGRVIIEQGGEADNFYVIKEGRVQIRRESGDYSSGLAELTSGEIFGEQAFIEPRSRRTATVRALTEVTAWEFPGEKFDDIFERNEQFRDLIVSALNERLRDTSEQAVKQRHRDNLLYKASLLLIHFIDDNYLYGERSATYPLTPKIEELAGELEVSEEPLKILVNNPSVDQLEELEDNVEAQIREVAQQVMELGLSKLDFREPR